jgi:hypothetical protein
MSPANGADCAMKRLFILFSLGSIFFLLRCAPPQKKVVKETPPVSPTAIDCPPNNLTARPGDGKLSLRWEVTCPDDVLLSGYNIYLLKTPLNEKYYGSEKAKKLKAYNLEPYPGDTDPEGRFETMEINNLDNGVEYFITVRTVFPDGRISSASNEVSAICRPEGEFTLAFRYADLNDGFSFSKRKATRADDSDNDIYFFEKDGTDFIASPHRLNGFLRRSGFYSLGKTENVYQYPKVEIDFPAIDKMPALVGESYLVKTADGNYIKLRIEDVSGTGKEKKLHIKYIYQPIKNTMRF